MKKQQIAAGLNGLLNAATETNTPQGTAPGATTNAGTRPVCYNLPPAIIEKVRYIAFMGHRKNNAVVSEALEQYVQEWERANGEIPVTL